MVAGKPTKKLVIVESPAKAKKIGGYLGANYTVMASMGHVRDLPESAADIPPEIKKLKGNLAKYGVDIENNFEPLYIVPKEKKKLVTEMKAARARRTRILCDLCHADTHRGRLPDNRKMDGIVAAESRMQ